MYVAAADRVNLIAAPQSVVQEPVYDVVLARSVSELVNVTAPVLGPVAGHVVEKDVTPLDPEGVAQVPSPRQKVVDDAPVPLLRLVTGRLPVTPVVRGRPVAFVRTPAEGVPRFGVVRVGEICRTPLPEPVNPI